MLVYVAFFGSLAGIVAMLGLKFWELNRGVKLLSVARYRADSLLRRKLSEFSFYLRFFNRRTFWLLILLSLRSLRQLARRAFALLEETKVGRMVRGAEVAESNGEASAFLKEIERDRKEGNQ